MPRTPAGRAARSPHAGPVPAPAPAGAGIAPRRCWSRSMRRSARPDRPAAPAPPAPCRARPSTSTGRASSAFTRLHLGRVGIAHRLHQPGAFRHRPARRRISPPESSPAASAPPTVPAPLRSGRRCRAAAATRPRQPDAPAPIQPGPAPRLRALPAAPVCACRAGQLLQQIVHARPSARSARGDDRLLPRDLVQQIAQPPPSAVPPRRSRSRQSGLRDPAAQHIAHQVVQARRR